MQNDTNLKQNHKIEEAISALQKAPDDELLAHALTVIRRQMKAGAHLITAVEADPASDSFTLRTVTTADGKTWFYAFTSYEEQFKGGDTIMSGFTSPIDRLFEVTLHTSEVEGLILNPWNCTLMLDKNLIRIILGV
ncbi:MAG: SseB family protein [Eubacteriales bacterium]|nr:SseB family protein [Eubacteriales bacterium]